MNEDKAFMKPKGTITSPSKKKKTNKKKKKKKVKKKIKC